MSGVESLERAKRVLRLERDALADAERRLGPEIAAAVDLIAACGGRVIVSGVGKSGLIGRKVAATLTSTGTPATFLHPADSVHGDLGIVGSSDAAILISKSGETTELLQLLQHLKRFGVRSIAITGGMTSSLARHADVVLDAAVREEACPHDLAPTTSTTVALALGDALAVALLQAKGFQREDFARLHPGGSLGRQLVTLIDQVMVKGPLPVLAPDATMRAAVVELAERRGIAIVMRGRTELLGVVTAGDLSRLMEREQQIFDIPVAGVMTGNPRVAHLGELASAVLFRMQESGIMAMPVLADDGALAGVAHLHDIMRAGVG